MNPPDMRIPGPIRTRAGRGTPEYTAYHTAKSKCENSQDSHWKYYGGRGIKFLFVDFVQWFTELGLRPTPKHSVDRIRTQGNYEPGNVRWATASLQIKNRRRVAALESFSTEELEQELVRRRGL